MVFGILGCKIILIEVVVMDLFVIVLFALNAVLFGLLVLDRGLPEMVRVNIFGIGSVWSAVAAVVGVFMYLGVFSF